MDVNRSVASERLRTAVALLYGVVVCIAILWLLPRTTASVPSLFIALGLPLALRLVPRNWVYGLRTTRTLWTAKETWYAQNAIAGIVLIGVGTVWLVVLAVR